MTQNLLRLPLRIVNHLFFDKSYQSYYSAQIWDGKFKNGFRLDEPQEDCRYGTLIAILKRYENAGPILDAGCGDGILQERFRTVSRVRQVGLDYAPEAIAKAKAREIPGCEFICSDYRQFEPKEKFSLLVFNEALYYIDNYLDLIDRMARHVSPDGHIVVSMFQTRVTSRIWGRLLSRYRLIQGAVAEDEQSGRKWNIRVFARPAG